MTGKSFISSEAEGEVLAVQVEEVGCREEEQKGKGQKQETNCIEYCMVLAQIHHTENPERIVFDVFAHASAEYVHADAPHQQAQHPPEAHPHQIVLMVASAHAVIEPCAVMVIPVHAFAAGVTMDRPHSLHQETVGT